MRDGKDPEKLQYASTSLMQPGAVRAGIEV
jgi:hypothetical protein